MHPAGDKSRNMFQQAEISGVEDKGAVVVLQNREIFSRPALFHQMVAPAAGLGTFPLVGVTPGHHAGNQTAAGVRDAERPMYKGLKFHSRHLDYRFADVVKACLLYTSPSPRDGLLSRMPSSA